jgi:hypothetical protein
MLLARARLIRALGTLHNNKTVRLNLKMQKALAQLECYNQSAAQQLIGPEPP